MTDNQSSKPVNKLSKFGRPFQEKTIAAIFTDKKFTEQIIDMLKPKYYENSETLEWIVDKTRTYWEKYRSLPTKDYFTTQANKERLDDVLKHSVTNTLTKINHHAENSSDLDYVKEEFLEFAKNQEMRRAILQSVELLESGQYDSIRDIIDSAINAGMDKDIGSLYTETLKDRISEEARITIPTPWNALNDIMAGGLGPGELGTIIGSTGCHAKGTNLMMYDGSLKAVEDIEVGDTLMGPDSTPRNVLRLCRGTQTMYRISPTKGKSFVVNEDHVLSLINSNGEHATMTVGEYMMSGSSDTTYYLHKPLALTHFEQSSEYEYNVDITKSAHAHAKLSQVERSHSIPDRFKYGRKEVRKSFILEFLRESGGRVVSKQVADDLQFMIYSMEWEPVVKDNGDHYEVRAHTTVDNSHLQRSFEITDLDKDDFYGFTLDNDHLYLDEDFNVHHNSGKTWCLCSIGLKAAMRGKFVAHYSLELSESNVNIRYDSILSELSPTDVKNNETRVQNSINENIPGEGEIVTKFWPAETVGVQSIRAHIAQLEAIHRKPDLIIVDYADLLNLGGSNSLDGDYERAGRLYVKLRSLAAEMEVPCWTVSQSNRDGEDADIITLKMIADSYKKAMHSDFIASISVTDSTEEDNMAMGSMNIIKNRFGSDTYVFPMILDFSKGFMQVYNDKNEQYEKNRKHIRNQSNKETREKTAPVVDQVLKKLEKERSQNSENKKDVSSSTTNNRPRSRHTFSN